MTDGRRTPGAPVVPARSDTDAVVAFDGEWRLTELNGAAERMLARPRAELLGAVVWALRPDRGAAPPAASPSPLEQAQQVQLYTEALAEAATVEDVTGVITRLVLPAFGGTGLLISLLDSGRLRLVGHTGYSPESVQRLDGQLLDGDGPIVDALRTRRAIFVPSFEDYTRRYPQREEVAKLTVKRAWAFLPLIVPGRALGSLTISFAEQREFAPADRAVLVSLAGLLAQCLERARLHDIEHELATELQRGLLPALLPTLEGVTSEGRYLPASEGIAVGGDWYDVIGLPSGGVCLVIGDVQGHSVAAAALMGQLRHALRAYAAEGHDPAAVMVRTNRLLCDLDTRLFATCACLCIDVAGASVTIVRAGHPYPLLRRADGTTEVLEVAGGLPLGIDPEADYPVTVLALAPADVLVAYTDGLVESAAVDVDTGTERLRAAVSAQPGSPALDLSTLVDRLVSLSTTGDSRADDVALVAMRYDGLAAAQRPLHANFDVDPGDFTGPRRTREFIRTTLAAWEALAVVDAAVLLTTEIVTNALRHGDGQVAVGVRLSGDIVRVEVADGATRRPRVVDARTTDTGGRGMHIVATLAQSWGTRPQGAGKVVWFDLRLP